MPGRRILLRLFISYIHYAMGWVQRRQMISKSQLPQSIKAGKKQVLNSYQKQWERVWREETHLQLHTVSFSTWCPAGNDDIFTGAVRSFPVPVYQHHTSQILFSMVLLRGFKRNKRLGMQSNKSYWILYFKQGQFIKTTITARDSLNQLSLPK